jgi:hypothetical protein
VETLLFEKRLKERKDLRFVNDSNDVFIVINNIINGACNMVSLSLFSIFLLATGVDM